MIRFPKNKYKRSSYYKIQDLLDLGPQFKKNRSFDSWTDVFYDSLKEVRSNSVNKPRTYEQLARRYPRKIVKIFLELLCEDLINENAYYVLNRRAEQDRHLKMRIAVHENRDYKSFYTKVPILYHSFGGSIYQLRVDNMGKLFRRPYIVGFYIGYVKKLLGKLRAGMRYYNSYKDKIYSEL